MGCSDAASTSSDRVATIDALTGDVTRGKGLYEAQCLDCHGANGRSGSASVDVGAFGKQDPKGAMAQILEGGGGMPAFDTLSDQDVADLVAYLNNGLQ